MMDHTETLKQIAYVADRSLNSTSNPGAGMQEIRKLALDAIDAGKGQAAEIARHQRHAESTAASRLLDECKDKGDLFALVKMTVLVNNMEAEIARYAAAINGKHCAS
jgi:hypothetical protein